MSNVLRKTTWPLLMKPIYIVKVVERALGGIPCFTELEIKWMHQYVKNAEEANLLYNARLEDPDYQILPDALVRRPPDPEPSPAVKTAQAEFFEYVNTKLRPGRRSGEG